MLAQKIRGEEPLRSYHRKGKRLKHLFELIGLTLIVVSSAVFWMGADRVVPVTCGQDLDVTVNSDSSAIGTRFQLAGGCTYTVDAVVAPKNGDEIAGPAGAFIERGPAFDPEPSVTIVASEGLSNVIRPQGTVHLEWVKIVGGTGQYSGGSPVAGTGSGLAMGMASNDSSLYAVHITQNDGAGITNAHGTFESIELSDTTNDPNFLGFIGSGLKAITEVEVRNSYIHDNQGNGIWCDQFCHDSDEQLHPNGFWIHENVVVNNGRAGIRFERVGDEADSGEALIENNEVHGNSTAAPRGGISVRDAQNATIQNNRFGATTIAGVVYPPNSSNVAIVASDSARTDRPDLFNIDIVGNILNGETISGCELPDEIVFCSEAQPPSPLPPPPLPPPPLSTDTTGSSTTDTTGTPGTATSRTDTTSTTTPTTENTGSSTPTDAISTASPTAGTTTDTTAENTGTSTPSPRDGVVPSTIPRGELPNTGGASVLALLIGTAAIGAGLLFMVRR
jgi:LPXTG-motif cell wall-anchored protein